MNIINTFKAVRLYAKLLTGRVTPHEVIGEAIKSIEATIAKIDTLIEKEEPKKNTEVTGIRHTTIVLDQKSHNEFMGIKASLGYALPPNQNTVYLNQVGGSLETVQNAVPVQESTVEPNNAISFKEENPSRKSKGRATSNKGRKGHSPDKARRPYSVLLKPAIDPPISFGAPIKTIKPKVISISIIG